MQPSDPSGKVCPFPVPAAVNLTQKQAVSETVSPEAFRHVAEMNRKMCIEAAACLVETMAEAFRKSRPEDLTPDKVADLLAQTVDGIRALKVSCRLA